MAAITITQRIGGPVTIDTNEIASVQPAITGDDPAETCTIILRDGLKLVLSDLYGDVWGAVCHYSQVAAGDANPVPLPSRYMIAPA